MVYSYIRVSTKGQAKDGNSLEFQEQELRTAGAEKIYKDVYTGTVKDRPELDRLMEAIQEGDTLVVSKLDRVARSVACGKLCAHRACEQPKSRFLCETECEDGGLLSD